MLLSYSVRVGSSLERKILNTNKPVDNAVVSFLSSRKKWLKEQELNDIKHAPRTRLKVRGGRLVKSEHQPFYN